MRPNAGRVSGSSYSDYSKLLNGQNAYEYLNAQPSTNPFSTQASTANTQSESSPEMNSLQATLQALGIVDGANVGKKAQTGKSSEAALKDVEKSKDYSSLSAAKTEVIAGKAKVTSSYNEDVSTYVSENAQATLSELGIEVPQLTPISGEYEKFDDDMKSLADDQGKVQKLSDTCNQRLPEISEKKAEAKAKVSSLRSQKWNLNKQIIAAKLTGNTEKLAELREELAQVKAELAKAKAEYQQYKEQEKALKEGIKEAQKKSKEIDKAKEDLNNYHEAETKIVDKTYEIAQNDDSKLQEKLTKLKEKKAQIKNATQDTSALSTDESDESRNKQLESLQKEYEQIALETSEVMVDLDLLIKENDDSKSVKNSSGGVYRIQHYDEAKQILESEEE